MTASQMRALFLAQPEAIEKSHFGKPDFRVNGKIFGGLSVDGKKASLKLSLKTQAAVLEHPETFEPAAGAWGRSGWTMVELASARKSDLIPLVAEAWSLIAAKKAPRPTRALAPTSRPKRKRTLGA